MKNIFLFLFTVICSVLTYAQEPTFNWGELRTKISTPAEVKILGYSAAGYYIVSKREPSFTEQQSIIRSSFSPVVHVEYINNTGVKILSRDISTGRSDDFVDVVYFNNSLQVISALFNKESGKNTLTAKAINSDGAESKAIVIGELNAAKMSQRGLFYVAASTDGSKLLVLSQPEYIKDQNEKIGISLYGKEFTKVWNSEQSFPYAWSKSVDNKPYVNNNGVAFIFKQINVKGSDDSWSVFSCTGKDLKEYKLGLDAGRKITSFVQAFSVEGDFAIAGYYKEQGAKIQIRMGDKANGSFLYRVDATGQQLKTGVVNSFEKRSDIIARDILFHDNTTILLSERYTISDGAAARSASTPQTNETMFARDYSYNGMDIYIDGFDATGKPIYNAAIDKNNSSKNDLGYWLSFFGAIVKSKLQLVFMDNFSRYDDRKISINTPNIIVYTTVDPVTGKAEKPQPVSNPGPVGGKGGDSYLRPDVFLKTGDGQYIIRAENGSSYRMGTMLFK